MLEIIRQSRETCESEMGICFFHLNHELLSTVNGLIAKIVNYMSHH